jgi:hypothetical protein
VSNFWGPLHYFANIYRRALIYRATTATTWISSQPNSIVDPARDCPGELRPKHSISYSANHYNHLVLR